MVFSKSEASLLRARVKAKKEGKKHIVEANKMIKPSKYRNKKVVHGEMVFDSTKEWKRYLVLKDMENKQEIFNLNRQKVFEIVHNGVKICKYKADFDYWKDGKHIVEDVKGFRTAMYRLKKKLVLAFHGVTIIEI